MVKEEDKKFGELLFHKGILSKAQLCLSEHRKTTQ